MGIEYFLGAGSDPVNCLIELIISKKKEADFRLRTLILTLKSLIVSRGKGELR
jgi:hypothetical protein